MLNSFVLKNMKTPIRHLIILLCAATLFFFFPKNEIIWQIGQADNSSSEFALYPDQYEQFLDHDFGWEDKFFLIDHSGIKEDWPYIMPGPSDQWGGTWGTAGWRSHTLTILFGQIGRAHV